LWSVLISFRLYLQTLPRLGRGHPSLRLTHTVHPTLFDLAPPLLRTFTRQTLPHIMSNECFVSDASAVQLAVRYLQCRSDVAKHNWKCVAKPSATRPLLCCWRHLATRLNDQATCTLRRLPNSSRDDGSKDCLVQIQQQQQHECVYVCRVIMDVTVTRAGQVDQEMTVIVVVPEDPDDPGNQDLRYVLPFTGRKYGFCSGRRVRVESG